MPDGLDHHGHNHDDALERQLDQALSELRPGLADPAKIYHFSVRDNHGHSARLTPFEIPMWMSLAIDKWCGRNQPFKNKAEFVRDALYRQVLRCADVWPEGGYANEEDAITARLEDGITRVTQRRAMLETLRERWRMQPHMSPTETQALLDDTYKLYQLFRDDGLDTRDIEFFLPVRMTMDDKLRDILDHKPES